MVNALREVLNDVLMDELLENRTNFEQQTCQLRALRSTWSLSAIALGFILLLMEKNFWVSERHTEPEVGFYEVYCVNLVH
jgi:hypothetical protein